MTGTAYRDDIVFYGSRVASGDIGREDAAEQLVEVSAHRMSVREARQAIDTWQGYLTSIRTLAPARSDLLRRLFTRNRTAS